MTHTFKTDPQSGAGSCTCGAAEAHARHVHAFVARARDITYCICGYWDYSEIHRVVPPVDERAALVAAHDKACTQAEDAYALARKEAFDARVALNRYDDAHPEPTFAEKVAAERAMIASYLNEAQWSKDGSRVCGVTPDYADRAASLLIAAGFRLSEGVSSATTDGEVQS